MDATIRKDVVRYTSGIDALTLMVDDPKSTVQVYHDLRDLWEALRQDGNRVVPFKLHRYAGHGCGPLRIGTDGASTVVQTTGPLSNSVGTIMAQYECRATRLDIQATFQFGGPWYNVAELLYNKWETEALKGQHKRANKLVKSSTGVTAYTGSRKGDRTFRVYDKSHQLQAQRGTFWRYEVEYHADKATGLWSGWKHAKDEKAWVDGAVNAAFLGIGIELGIVSTDTGSAMEVPGNLRSVERYLKWFQTSVAPVVRDLTGKVESDILLEALGLQGFLPMFDNEKE